MEHAFNLAGGDIRIEKYQVAATEADLGTPFLIPGAGNAGIVQATTTGAVDMIGCNLDLATYVTAQQTDGSSAERTVSVITNPDAVWRIKMSGGATENTALTAVAVTTASTTGLTITTAEDWSSPEMDEGFTWAYDGANAGQARKITSTTTLAGTVTVAFDYDTVVGDNFLRCPYSPGQSVTLQLTTNLIQADASIAVGTGADFRCYRLLLRDQTDSGKTNSFVYALSDDHCFSGRTT